MSLTICGMGTALPSTAVSQSEAALIANRLSCRDDEQAAVLPNLYRQTGVVTRHLVFDGRFIQDVMQGTAETGCVFLPTGKADDRGPTTKQRMERYAKEAGPLALAAAAQALAQSGLGAGDITQLVTVSCTGFSAPGLDIGLMTGLGLSPNVERVNVGFMGCHGAINGLRVALAFTRFQPAACVLVCAVELCSLHYHYGWDPKKMVSNALFADGAAAVVGTAAAGGRNGQWRLAATGSCLFPDTEYAMTWTIGDHGFEMTLLTRVPALIAANIRPWLEGWLGKQGLAVPDVRSWAVHPGGPRILAAVQEGLGLGGECLATSREVLASCGNMSSPTLLFIIDRLRHRQAPLPCVALGFGPGLVAEAALFQ